MITTLILVAASTLLVQEPVSNHHACAGQSEGHTCQHEEARCEHCSAHHSENHGCAQEEQAEQAAEAGCTHCENDEQNTAQNSQHATEDHE